jgi:hypothetical protein
MSESQWYRDYSDAGEPPHCRRLSRLPMREQYGVGIDLAIAQIEGRASYRNTVITIARVGSAPRIARSPRAS